MREPDKHEWIKFFCRDWLGDAHLRLCTAEERGVWIDLLCLMAGGEPYGYLALAGKPMPDAAVARAIGMDVERYLACVESLESKGIPSRTLDGMLFSRRLVREHNRFVVGRRTGKRGGSPLLCHPPTPPQENTNTNTIQIPEAIYQRGVKGRVKGICEKPLRVPLTVDGEQEEIFSLTACKQAASAIGMPDSMVEAFWAHYAAVGFIDAAGRKITHLRAALAKWKAQQAERAAKGIGSANKSTADMIAESQARLAGGGAA